MPAIGEPMGPARSGRPDDRLRDAVPRTAMRRHDRFANVTKRLAPQLRTGEARPLHEGVELRPHDARMDPTVKRSLGETAIGSGKKIFTSDQPRDAHDPFGDELRMFDHIGGMTDDARKE